MHEIIQGVPLFKGDQRTGLARGHLVDRFFDLFDQFHAFVAGQGGNTREDARFPEFFK